MCSERAKWKYSEEGQKESIRTHFKSCNSRSTILHKDVSSNRLVQHCAYCRVAVAHAVSLLNWTHSFLITLLKTFHIHAIFNRQWSPLHPFSFTHFILRGGFAKKSYFVQNCIVFKILFEVLVEATKHPLFLNSECFQNQHSVGNGNVCCRLKQESV